MKNFLFQKWKYHCWVTFFFFFFYKRQTVSTDSKKKLNKNKTKLNQMFSIHIYKEINCESKHFAWLVAFAIVSAAPHLTRRETKFGACIEHGGLPPHTFNVTMGPNPLAAGV